MLERATTPLLARPGHLLFARDGTIFAVPIDLGDRCAARRGPSRHAAGIAGTSATGSMTMRVSASGTLVMVPAGYSAKTVCRSDATDRRWRSTLPGGRYANPRVSPDGRRLLVENYGTEMSVFDFARGTLERLSPAAYGTNFGTWSAGGDRVMFRMFNTPVWANADGSGKTTPVPGGYVNNYPAAPGPMRDSIFIVRIVEGGSGDIALVSLSGAFARSPSSRRRATTVVRRCRRMAAGCCSSPPCRVKPKPTSNPIPRSTANGRCRPAAGRRFAGAETDAKSTIGPGSISSPCRSPRQETNRRSANPSTCSWTCTTTEPASPSPTTM